VNEPSADGGGNVYGGGGYGGAAGAGAASHAISIRQGYASNGNGDERAMGCRPPHTLVDGGGVDGGGVGSSSSGGGGGNISSYVNVANDGDEVYEELEENPAIKTLPQPNAKPTGNRAGNCGPSHAPTSTATAPPTVGGRGGRHGNGTGGPKSVVVATTASTTASISTDTATVAAMYSVPFEGVEEYVEGGVGTVRVFRRKFNACSLEVGKHVTNGIPLGCPLSYRFTL
jgi:hypothetical protein